MERRVLAGMAIVTLCALLGLALVISGAPACHTPSLVGCPSFLPWAFGVLSLLVLSGLCVAVEKIRADNRSRPELLDSRAKHDPRPNRPPRTERRHRPR